MPQELTEIQKEWIAALRSGEFEQGADALCRNEKYCCLGVLCEILYRNHPEVGLKKSVNKGITRYNNSWGFLPEEARSVSYLFSTIGEAKKDSLKTLITLNDGNTTFEEIADILEKTPELYFEQNEQE